MRDETATIEFNCETFVHIAADSIEQLRKIDVSRLLIEVPEVHREALAMHIKLHRLADLAEEVDAVLADLGAPPVANPEPVETEEEAAIEEFVGPPAPPSAKPMRVLCERKPMLAALKRISGAIPRREVKPILRSVHCSANGKVVLQATDLDVGIRLDVAGARTIEDGQGMIPASKFIQMLNASTEKDLILEVSKTAGSLAGEYGKFEMPSEDADLFPQLPEWNFDSYHEIAADVLLEMLRQTFFAAARDESARFTMTGVLWVLEGDHVRLVATDGRRLAQTDGAAKSVNGHEAKFLSTMGNSSALVPVNTMALLEKQLKSAGFVRVHFRPNEVFFRTEECTIYSRLVDGRFPDYRQVFPRKPAQTAKLPAAALLAALKNASVMTAEDTRRVTFQFDATGEGKLTLITKGASEGRSEVSLKCQWEGRHIDINFNPWYLLEWLKLLPKKAEVAIDLIDGATPAVFRGGELGVYLVMPLS